MRTLIAATVLGILAAGCDQPTGPADTAPVADAPNLGRSMGLYDRIVFESDRGGFPQIFIMNSDGTNERGLTTAASFPTGAYDPSLSPTGTHVAFGYDGDVWVMFADGSRPTQLTTAGISNMDMSWSPDGQKIVFARNLPGADSEIFWVTLDGLTEQQVTNDWGASARDPVWNPNGLTIAFERNTDIYEVDATCLNCSGGGLLLDGARDMVWSPDGSQIAYVWKLNIHANDELWINDYPGTFNPTQVTIDAAVEGNPAWSPDGAQIVFDTDRSSVGWTTRDVWRVRLSDMRPVQLTYTGGDNVVPTWAIVPKRYR